MRYLAILIIDESSDILREQAQAFSSCCYREECAENSFKLVPVLSLSLIQG